MSSDRRQLAAHDARRACGRGGQRAVDDIGEHERGDHGDERGQLVAVVRDERRREHGNIRHGMDAGGYRQPRLSPAARAPSRGALDAGARPRAERACVARGVARAVDVAARRLARRGLLGLSCVRPRARHGRLRPARADDAARRLGDLLVSPLARWDAVWYLAIAHDGYDGERPRRRPPSSRSTRCSCAGRRLGRRLAAARRRAGLARVLPRRRSCCCTGSSRSSWAPRPRARRCCCSRSSRCARSSRRSTPRRCSCCCRSARSTRRGRSAGRGPARSAALAALTRSAGVLLLLPLVLLFLYGPRAGGVPAAGALAGCRATGSRRSWRGWRSCRSGWRLPRLSASRSATRSRRSTPRRSGPRVRRAVRLGAWDGVVAASTACASCRRLARRRSTSRRPAATRSASRARTSTLFGFLCFALVGARRRAAPAAVRLRRLRRAALLLPLSYPVAPQPLMSLPRFVRCCSRSSCGSAGGLRASGGRPDRVAIASRGRCSGCSSPSSRPGTGSA